MQQAVAAPKPLCTCVFFVGELLGGREGGRLMYLFFGEIFSYWCVYDIGIELFCHIVYSVYYKRFHV